MAGVALSSGVLLPTSGLGKASAYGAVPIFPSPLADIGAGHTLHFTRIGSSFGEEPQLKSLRKQVIHLEKILADIPDPGHRSAYQKFARPERVNDLLELQAAAKHFEKLEKHVARLEKHFGKMGNTIVEKTKHHHVKKHVRKAGKIPAKILDPAYDVPPEVLGPVKRTVANITKIGSSFDDVNNFGMLRKSVQEQLADIPDPGHASTAPFHKLSHPEGTEGIKTLQAYAAAQKRAADARAALVGVDVASGSDDLPAGVRDALKRTVANIAIGADKISPLPPPTEAGGFL